MILTRKQEEGLHIAIERYKNHEKYTIISGFAGSGKSTLVKFIIAALADYGIDPEEDVVFATFTGKAAQVLSQKGNKNAKTLHKLLYKSFPQPDGTFRRKPIPVNEKIVVVDEISMAPKRLVDQLFTNNCYVIGLGDPCQLPSIYENENNHLLDNPHIFLDEIMRQAKDSEIIRLTMDIRNHNPISKVSTGNEVHILSYKNLSIEMLEWADQILVATNNKRKEINMAMRQARGFEGETPLDGDKVICCRNYWDYLDSDDNALVNGTIGYLSDPYQDINYISPIYNPNKLEVTRTKFISEIGTSFSQLELDTKMILTGEKCLDKKTNYLVQKNRKYRDLVPLEFAYGYAITCHRAQGSEWDDVVVLEEGFPYDKEEHARWLYTACTRAAKRLILIQRG